MILDTILLWIISDISSIIIGAVSIYIAFKVWKATAKIPHIKIDYIENNRIISNNWDKTIYNANIQISKIYINNYKASILNPRYSLDDEIIKNRIKQSYNFSRKYEIWSIPINHSININNCILWNNNHSLEITEENYNILKKNWGKNFKQFDEDYEYSKSLTYHEIKEKKLIEHEIEAQENYINWIIEDANINILSIITEIHIIINWHQFNETIVYKKI